jgi:hypothetical protein
MKDKHMVPRYRHRLTLTGTALLAIMAGAACALEHGSETAPEESTTSPTAARPIRETNASPTRAGDHVADEAEAAEAAPPHMQCTTPAVAPAADPELVEVPPMRYEVERTPAKLPTADELRAYRVADVPPASDETLAAQAQYLREAEEITRAMSNAEPAAVEARLAQRKAELLE